MSGIWHNQRTNFLDRKFDQHGIKDADVDTLIEDLAGEGRTSVIS